MPTDFVEPRGKAGELRQGGHERLQLLDAVLQILRLRPLRRRSVVIIPASALCWRAACRRRVLQERSIPVEPTSALRRRIACRCGTLRQRRIQIEPTSALGLCIARGWL